MPLELTLVGASTILLLVYVMVQGQTATRERGMDWNAGPRDGDAKPLGPVAGRAARALANFQETYPAFLALALGLAVAGKTGGLGAVGAATWFGARIVYLPLYLAGIPYIRSLVWAVSILGLALMLFRLL
ncbi:MULTISPECIES: MAPEG family protein [Sphingomonas]|jgi:uncharacterized MAPEG superfamily protein|uniref:MAPEG family protein n=1 Tax=Sphingomonas TaxID=13687 RepID=UPI00193B6771|nr:MULTISPECIES: MAPEG family protein [Sphingomonas]